MNLGNFAPIKGLSFVLKLGWAYARANRLTFTAGLLVGLLIIFFLPSYSAVFWRPPIVSVGLAGNVTASDIPRIVQAELSMGLTAVDETGQAKPAAAVSWQASDSGRSLTFNLRRDLFWQDKAKFTSLGVNYNLKGVTLSRPDEYTVKFSLSDPFAPLDTIVSQPLFKNGLVGLGERGVAAVHFNGRFISSINSFDQKTKEGIIYKFFPTEAEVVLALKLGQIRSAWRLSESYGFEADKHYRLAFQIDPFSQVMLFFNTQAPLLADKSFRQALVYALPDTFVFGETAASPLPRQSWAGNDLVKEYPQSLEAAQRLLGKDASVAGTIRLTISTTRELRSVADELAGAWNKLGIEVGVAVVDYIPSSYDAYLTTVVLPYDPDQYFLWHSTQTGNISHYHSPKVDKLLEEGRKEIDRNARADIYANFQKAITEDVPAAFLYYPRLYTITRR